VGESGGAGGAAGAAGRGYLSNGLTGTVGITGSVGSGGAAGSSMGLWVINSAAVTATNNILAHLVSPVTTTYGVRVAGGATATLSHNDVWTHAVQYSGVAAPPSDIQQYPLFVDWAGRDFHLQGCSSPCADAGAAVPVYEDGDGEPRPWGGFDIGYDEFWPFGVTSASGTIAADTTWSGRVFMTGDVAVHSGAALTVSPGATVYASMVDAAALGLDAQRVELIVSGTLRTGAAGGAPVTFTVASGCGSPEPGQWVGIQYRPGSRGYLDPTVVEYGIHGVWIGTANTITIADSLIRYNRHAPASGDAWGAGLTILTGTHTVADTQITSNSLEVSGAEAMGAGVYLAAGSTLFEGCTVFDNVAQAGDALGAAYGGGLALNGGGAPTLRNCQVYDNRAIGVMSAQGGGVSVDGAAAVIDADTVIHGNAVTATSYGYGGGVALAAPEEQHPAPVIRDSQVTSNTCTARLCFGGGIGFVKGAATRAVISRTLVAGNVARGSGGTDRACGGGIGMTMGATADRFDSNRVHSNWAQAETSAWGGGIGIEGESNAVTVTNNLIFDNRAESIQEGGGSGGGIYAGELGAPCLVNNTVVSNAATDWGGGIYFFGSVLSNTIVVGNLAGSDGGGVYWAGGSAGYNDVWGNSPANYDKGSSTPETDIVADPLFIGSGDPPAFYHLQRGSPCIDRGYGPGVGVPFHDYDGQTRPLSSTWDIGFDEVSPCEAVAADFAWGPVPVLVNAPTVFTVTLAAGTPPITFTWLWGDVPTPTATTLTSTVHAFTISGTLPVTLSAQNDCFDDVVAVHSVDVEPRRIYLPLVLRTSS